jgi:hypothetical protein
MSNRFARQVLLAALTCTAAAAANAQDTVPQPVKVQKEQKRRVDRNVITRDDMLTGNYSSAYDAVSALRSMWMRPRGANAQSTQAVVWTYIDGVKVGGVEALQTIQPRLVNTLRYYDGPSATSRWGVDHAAGVIFVSTWKEGAPTDKPAGDSTRRKPTG